MKQNGFTLVECLVALAIYTLIIATLVTVTKTSTMRMTELESHALARLALSNLMVEVQQGSKTHKIGSSNGQLDFGHQHYRWEMSIELSEAGITRVAKGKLFDKNNILIVTQQIILVNKQY